VGKRGCFLNVSDISLACNNILFTLEALGKGREPTQSHFNADPDPAFHFNADPDPAFHLKANPDPAFHLNAGPDPTFHFNADPDPGFPLMRIQLPTKTMRIRTCATLPIGKENYMYMDIGQAQCCGSEIRCLLTPGSGMG
jgi:hypothetical protein